MISRIDILFVTVNDSININNMVRLIGERVGRVH